MSNTHRYQAQLRLEDILDDDGTKLFEPRQVAELKANGFYILQDLFFQRLVNGGYGSQLDPDAGRARTILRRLDPQSNRVNFILSDLYNRWRSTLDHERKKRLQESSAGAVGRIVTAHVGRNSRVTRAIFYQISNAEIQDIACPNGKRRETDFGGLGFKRDEEDFGYNG